MSLALALTKPGPDGPRNLPRWADPMGHAQLEKRPAAAMPPQAEKGPNGPGRNASMDQSGESANAKATEPQWAQPSTAPDTQLSHLLMKACTCRMAA